MLGARLWVRSSAVYLAGLLCGACARVVLGPWRDGFPQRLGMVHGQGLWQRAPLLLRISHRRFTARALRVTKRLFVKQIINTLVDSDQSLALDRQTDNTRAMQRSDTRRGSLFAEHVR